MDNFAFLQTWFNKANLYFIAATTPKWLIWFPWILLQSFTIVHDLRCHFIRQNLLCLQWLKLCAKKTEVVEMDEISKFKFDLNRCLGTYNYALQYKNTNCSFKMKLLVFEISWKMSFFKYRSKNSRSLLLFFFFFFFHFGCVGPRWNHKPAQKILVRYYGMVKSYEYAFFWKISRMNAHPC